MKSKPFQKTILALLVGTAWGHAGAVEFDLGQGPNSWTGQSFGESVTLTGGRALSALSPDKTGVAFAQTNIRGSLVNQADITSDAGLGLIRMLAVDGGFSNQTGGRIEGDIIQNGKITLSNGQGAEGFEVGDTTVGGSIVNSGAITLVQASGTSPSYVLEGMYLHGTTVAGDVSNTGSIDVSGEDATGLVLDSHGTHPVTIGGKILNAGTIRVTGNEAAGFQIETISGALKIENSGLISAIGTNAQAVTFYDGTIDSVLNTGTIEGKGENTNAFMLKGVTFTQDAPTGARGIVNRGVITSDGVAISVSTEDQRSVFEINQQAGEIRSNSGTAIDGAQLAQLNWTGGKVTGDVLNVTGVNISGQADFVGRRIVSPVSIASGSLNLASQGTTLVGDLSVGSGAGIDMRLTNSVVPTTPYLNVDGTATFAPSASVTLSANPGDFYALPSGTQYTLVKANSVQNDGLRVASRSALLEVLSYSSDAQTVKAVVSLKGDSQVEQELAGQGAAQSTIHIVNTFKNEVMAQLSQDDPVFQALANESTALGVTQLGERLQPDVNRGVLDIALSGQTAVSGAIFNRIAGQRTGQVPGNTALDRGVWVHGLSSNQDQDRRRGSTGYSANSSGIAVGADGKLNANTTLGVAYSYLNANIHSDLGNKTDVQGNVLSLYGSWTRQNGFVDGNLSYGHNENDSKRFIADTAAKGRYDSNVVSMSLLGGYTFKPSEHVLLEPRVAARYANVRMDGFKEHGSSASLNNGSQRYDVGELGAGLRVAGSLPLMSGNLQPEATLMAYHDVIGDRVAQTSSFVLGGSSFTVTGASVARDSYEATVGLNYAVSALTLGARYSYQARSGFDADTMTLKASYAF